MDGGAGLGLAFAEISMTDSKRSQIHARTSRRARRVAVEEKPRSAGEQPDYADAFEIETDRLDARSAEQVARVGFQRLPWVLRRATLLVHRWVLGFRLGPWSSPEHIFGWSIVTSRPDLLHLEARSPLMVGHMLWRIDDRRLVMSTFLHYKRRTVAPLVWAIIGNIHRGGAPYLLRLAANYGAYPPGAPVPR
jgi:hypothetical protein